MNYSKQIEGYIEKTVLSNGQIACIVFQENKYKNFTDYYVMFAIANKKKDIKNWLSSKHNNIDNKQTGRCGIEGLIWAKNKVIEFEKHIKDRHYTNRNIVISWADKKRKDVYVKAMMKLGYKNDTTRACLFKKVEVNNDKDKL